MRRFSMQGIGLCLMLLCIGCGSSTSGTDPSVLDGGIASDAVTARDARTDGRIQSDARPAGDAVIMPDANPSDRGIGTIDAGMMPEDMSFMQPDVNRPPECGDGYVDLGEECDD